MDIHSEPFKCSKLECQGCIKRAGGTPRALRRLTPVVILRSLSALREFMCVMLFHTGLSSNLCWRSSQRDEGAEHALILVWAPFPPTFPIISITWKLFPLRGKNRYGSCYTALESSVRSAFGFASVLHLALSASYWNLFRKGKSGFFFCRKMKKSLFFFTAWWAHSPGNYYLTEMLIINKRTRSKHVGMLHKFKS